MEFQEIDIFINPNGKIRLEVRGVKGKACLDLTRDLEAALGGQIESREMTSDTYEQTRDQIQDRVRQKNK